MLRRLVTAGMGGTILIATILAAATIGIALIQDDEETGRLARTYAETYTGALWVNVTSDINSTIDGATVHLLGNDTWRTNATGAVTITGLLADTNGTEYILWAEMEGFESSVPRSVVVTPSNVTYVNLTVRGAVVYGSVTEDGGPISGANVTIPELGMSVLTDALGSYVLEGVRGGDTYSIVANATNHEPAAKFVTVPVGGAVSVYFSLSSLTGDISGSVLHSETLEPLWKANVSIVVGVLTITVSTDQNGSFFLPNLPAGVYSLTASLEGFNSSSITGVTVESGETTEDVLLYLDEKTTKLIGVVKAGTVLLVGANVTVDGTGYYGLSSIEGTYEIIGIPAGTYTVSVALQGYYNMTVAGVEIRRGFELQLNFNLTGLPGALYGVVFDAETGDRLAGVKVVVLPQRETITNTNGEFQFTGLLAGEYIVRFTLDGYQPVEMGPVNITLEQTTQMGNILLEPTRESFGGFVFGFDLPHSMMILALFLTIVILAVAVVLRIRTFEAPDKAPAVYDEFDEEEQEEAASEEATQEPNSDDSAFEE